MNVRKAQVVRDILFLAGVVTMLCAHIYVPLWFVGVAVVCVGLFVHFRYNKCPQCGKQIGRNAAKYCPHCGEALE